MSSQERIVIPTTKNRTRPFAYEEARENTPASRDRQMKTKETGSWGVGVVKSILTSPFYYTKNLLQKKQVPTDQVSVNFHRDWLKLIRIKKLRINSQSLFEIRYVQYFTPNQILPLFNDNKMKMQTRVQLIDAHDWNGKRLGK